MPFTKLSLADLDDYKRSYAGSSPVNQFSGGDLFMDSVPWAWTNGITGASIEFLSSNLRALKSHNKEDIVTGYEANNTYGFEGEDAFDPDAQVLIEEAEIKHRRLFDERMRHTIDEIADSQGTMVGFSRFLGELTGGFLDPIALLGGAAIGNALRMAPGALLSATKHHKFIRQHFSLLNNARKMANTTNAYTGSLEAMVGAAVLDVPAQLYLANKYNKEFGMREFTAQVLGAGIFGAALPIAGKAIKSGVVGAMEGLQSYKATLFKKFGSDVEEVLEETLAHGELANNLDAVPDETVMTRIQKERLWNTREGQSEYSFAPMMYEEDVQLNDFWVGRRHGEKRFREAVDYGPGTVLLTDNHNLAWNSVQDINGKHSGELKSVRFKDGKRVLMPNNFIAHKAAIIKTFKKFIEDVTYVKKSGKDLEETLAALNRLEHSMQAATNMAEMHEAVSFSVVSKHPEDYLNRAIKKNGFDGYHVLIADPLDEDFANGIVLLDLADSAELQQGKTSYDMVEGLFNEEDIASSDGIMSFFDEDKLSVTNRKEVPKIDLDADGTKTIRKNIGEIQKAELARLNSPQAKIGYVNQLIADDEIADALTREDLDAIIDTQLDAIDSITSREDLPEGILSETDAKFINNARERIKSSEEFGADMHGCLGAKDE